ncbi:hypothetical protein BH23ACT11_BH23ACT11_19880 [soil metagenome]
MRHNAPKAVNRRDLRQWARRLKTEVYALYLAFKDPRVPWYARAFVAVVVGYAFSPIDLIPDPIPVLGYLDDIILLPLGIALAIRMIPADVLSDCRENVRTVEDKPVNKTAAAVVILLWLLLAATAVALVLRLT